MDPPTLATAVAHDGVHIAYETYGNGPATLIFLHGWDRSAAYWREASRHMDVNGRRAVSISYRGHGDSDKSTDGYDLDTFTEDILAVADAVNARTFVLVGFSMSGRFARCLAARSVRSATIGMFTQGSFVEEVRQLNSPVLVITGERDPILGPDYQRNNTLAHLRTSRMAALPCGHEMPHEMPQETVGLINAFLAGTSR